MKTITRVRVRMCEGFNNALRNPKDFQDLHMYCSHWANTMEKDGTILCEIVDDIDIKTGKPKKSLDIELSLFDYFFNVDCDSAEEERQNLWKAVNQRITWEIVKIVKV